MSAFDSSNRHLNQLKAMNRPSLQLKRRDFLKKTTLAAAFSWGVACFEQRLRALEYNSTPTLSQNPIKVGILLGTFGRKTLEERLEAAKSNGIDCIQLSFDCAGLSEMPDGIAPEIIAKIRRETDARKITIASLQGTFNMGHPDAELRQTGLRRLQVLAKASPQLGVRIIHICTGTRDRNSMWRRHPENGSQAAWRDMVACVREATDIASRAGVILAFEPEVNNIVDSAKKARLLLDEISSSALKVTIDPANIFHTGELPRMKEMLDEAFSLIGKDIALAHAKDLDHDGDAGHLAAGKGKLDYDRYLYLLRSYQFQGPLLLHGLSETQVPGCMDFLRNKLASVSSPNSGK